VRQNVLDMTLHIAQYSNIIADLRDEIRRLRQKLDQQTQQQPQQKHGPGAATATGDCVVYTPGVAYLLQYPN